MLRQLSGAVALFLASILLSGAAAVAQADLSVLVLGDDSDVESLPRHMANVDHMLQGLAGEVEARGFGVFGEGDIDDARLDEGRVNLRPPELAEIAAQLNDPSVGVVTAVRVYARAVPDPTTRDVNLLMNVSGRMFQVPGGRPIGQYQVDVAPGDLPPVPEDCDDACIETFLSEQFERVGADVGRQLATRLDLIAR